ncbi:reverse transcriptase domain-containing protein [Tanacetum coccineum]
MMRSTIKRLMKPLDEPEREFQRRRKAALRSHQNESLAIAGRNLFNDEASSSYNTGAKPPMPPKTLHEHSHPNSFDFLNLITFPTEQIERIVDSRDIWLIQNTYTFQGLRNEDPLRHIRHYLSIVYNIQANGATRDTSRLRFFHFSLKGKVAEWLVRIPPTQITTWDQLMSRFLDHFFLDDRRKLDQFAQFCFDSLTEEEGWNRIEEYVQYQDDPWDDVTTTPHHEGTSNIKKGEDGPEYIIRSKFEDELANFMLEKKSCVKGIGDMLVQHHKELREQYSQILSTINKSKTPDPEAPTLAITTRSGISTQDPPFPAPPRLATDNFTEGETEKKGLRAQNQALYKNPSLSHPSFTNLPTMIHMPKRANVLKDLLSHKEKLEKEDSSVKLSEECFAIIQRSLPQKERDPRSFTLPCLIGPLSAKNALADLGASINLMPHSLL